MNTHTKHLGLRSLALVVVIAALLFGGISIAGAAAQAAIPGDALYPVKTSIEQTRLSLAQDAGDRAQMRMGFAEQRLKEIAALIEEGRYREVGAAVLAFEADIHGAILELETISQIDPARGTQIALKITEALTLYAQTLSAMAANAPQSVTTEVSRALDTTQIASGLEMPFAGWGSDDNGNDNIDDDANSNGSDDSANSNGNDDNANSNGDDDNANSNDNGEDDNTNASNDNANANGIDDNAYINGNGDDDSANNNGRDDNTNSNSSGVDDNANANSDDNANSNDNGEDDNANASNDNGDDNPNGNSNSNDDDGNDNGNDSGGGGSDDNSNTSGGDDSGGNGNDRGNDDD